jgi:integrase
VPRLRQAWRRTSSRPRVAFLDLSRTSARSSGLSDWYWVRDLKTLVVSAGVTTKAGKAKYTGLHAFRHFYASWCINRKVDAGLELPAKLVQTRMGHATIGITLDLYGHLFKSEDDGAELAAAEKLLFA